MFEKKIILAVLALLIVSRASEIPLEFEDCEDDFKTTGVPNALSAAPSEPPVLPHPGLCDGVESNSSWFTSLKSIVCTPGKPPSKPNCPPQSQPLTVSSDLPAIQSSEPSSVASASSSSKDAQADDGNSEGFEFVEIPFDWTAAQDEFPEADKGESSDASTDGGAPPDPESNAIPSAHDEIGKDSAFAQPLSSMTRPVTKSPDDLEQPASEPLIARREPTMPSEQAASSIGSDVLSGFFGNSAPGSLRGTSVGKSLDFTSSSALVAKDPKEDESIAKPPSSLAADPSSGMPIGFSFTIIDDFRFAFERLIPLAELQSDLSESGKEAQLVDQTLSNEETGLKSLFSRKTTTRSFPGRAANLKGIHVKQLKTVKPACRSRSKGSAPAQTTLRQKRLRMKNAADAQPASVQEKQIERERSEDSRAEGNCEASGSSGSDAYTFGPSLHVPEPTQPFELLAAGVEELAAMFSTATVSAKEHREEAVGSSVPAKIPEGEASSLPIGQKQGSQAGPDLFPLEDCVVQKKKKVKHSAGEKAKPRDTPLTPSTKKPVQAVSRDSEEAPKAAPAGEQLSKKALCRSKAKTKKAVQAAAAEKDKERSAQQPEKQHKKSPPEPLTISKDLSAIENKSRQPLAAPAKQLKSKFFLHYGSFPLTIYQRQNGKST